MRFVDPVDLLQELIRIPSVNPDGDPGTTETGEKEIADFVHGLLASLGAETELREVEPGRPNILARFRNRVDGAPRLLLAPHLDTVSVKGMTISPFCGEIRDGRVWGRGASDTKGSIAAIVAALGRCREVLDKCSYEIWFAGLMGEEAGLQGARALATQEMFDFVIVGEPTGLEVVHATKGCTWVTARTRGRAVHAATPDAGESAIYRMADIIDYLRREVAEDLRGFKDDALGSPTVSVGVISGGSKTNIVPDSCEMMVDFRTVSGQDLSEVFDRMRQMGAELEMTQAPPMETDPGHPLIALLGDLGAPPVGAPWFCDGAIFSSAGMPAIALGPGSIAQAHTEDEWIAVDDVRAGADFFERFLLALAEQ